MRATTTALSVLILLAGSALAQQQDSDSLPAESMSPERLDQIYRLLGENVVSGHNVWSFSYGGIDVTSVISVPFDRMRIMAPIIAIDEVTEAQKDRLLEANYESALDVRYGVNEGILYAAFIHPLSTLNDRSVASALRQVATLAATFGSHYTSGELQFSAPAQPSGDESDRMPEDERDEVGT